MEAWLVLGQPRPPGAARPRMSRFRHPASGVRSTFAHGLRLNVTANHHNRPAYLTTLLLRRRICLRCPRRTRSPSSTYCTSTPPVGSVVLLGIAGVCAASRRTVVRNASWNSNATSVPAAPRRGNPFPPCRTANGTTGGIRPSGVFGIEQSGQQGAERPTRGHVGVSAPCYRIRSDGLPPRGAHGTKPDPTGPRAQEFRPSAPPAPGSAQWTSPAALPRRLE
jgi:hypothetical protein